MCNILGSFFKITSDVYLIHNRSVIYKKVAFFMHFFDFLAKPNVNHHMFNWLTYPKRFLKFQVILELQTQFR